jgi:hypothetical protein
MRLPLSKRDFDIFLSHAHKDRAFVESLESWLTEKAGFSVWYDARELSGGALLATDLQTAIERCRAILLIASGESLDRGWVKAEYNSAMDERANEEGFRIVALRLGSANVTNLMRGITWIDVPEGGLDRDTALSVIRAFYPGEKRPNPATARDVYISCSWQQKDGVSARAVCSHLVKQGFRLVGDARDQKGFGAGDRVERIIASCGAFVGIVPFRDTEVANASEKPYKYFIQEMDFAAARGLPSVIVADPRVRRTDGPDSDWLRMETESDKCPNDVSSVLGNEIHDEPLHSAIMEKIRGAFLVLADITDDNINACIEAGMGLAAGTNVEILAQGKPRRPPFMLRSLQMSTYENEVEQMGLVHKIVRPYRRRVINAEL